jgi:hypothetical protein
MIVNKMRWTYLSAVRRERLVLVGSEVMDTWVGRSDADLSMYEGVERVVLERIASGETATSISYEHPFVWNILRRIRNEKRKE